MLKVRHIFIAIGNTGAFHDLVREQQGDVVRNYYFASHPPNGLVRFPLDLTAWNPYLAEIRQLPR